MQFVAFMDFLFLRGHKGQRICCFCDMNQFIQKCSVFIGGGGEGLEEEAGWMRWGGGKGRVWSWVTCLFIYFWVGYLQKGVFIIFVGFFCLIADNFSCNEWWIIYEFKHSIISLFIFLFVSALLYLYIQRYDQGPVIVTFSLFQLIEINNFKFVWVAICIYIYSSFSRLTWWRSCRLGLAAIPH